MFYVSNDTCRGLDTYFLYKSIPYSILELSGNCLSFISDKPQKNTFHTLFNILLKEKHEFLKQIYTIKSPNLHHPYCSNIYYEDIKSIYYNYDEQYLDNICKMFGIDLLDSNSQTLFAVIIPKG